MPYMRKSPIFIAAVFNVLIRSCHSKLTEMGVVWRWDEYKKEWDSENSIIPVNYMRLGKLIG